MLTFSRGQSIPFWTFATIGMLGVMLFVLNYAINVTWAVRAQNAADSAAAATYSSIADVYNEETTLLYAASVDEFRLRALNQAILNTINHNGGCSPAVGGTCEQNYNQLVAGFVQVSQNYSDLVHLLGQANQLTQAGQQVAAQKIFNLINCGGNNSVLYLDCAFDYTFANYASSKGHGNKATPTVVQVVACRNVPWIGGGLLGASGTFQALASGATAIALVKTENFVASAINPNTNAPYQANESSWYGYALPAPSPPYEVVFDGGSTGQALNIALNWYTPVPYANASSVAPGSYTCAS